MQTKHLSPSPASRAGAGVGRARRPPSRRPRRRRAGRVGTKMPRRGVVLDPRARLGEQRVGGLAAARGDEQVAVDARVPSIVDRGEPAAAARGRRARGSRSRRSTDAAISTPARVSSSAARAPRSSVATTTARVAGLERPVVDQPAHAAGQHDADEVVAREDERLLERARGDDDPPGAEAVEHIAGVDRDEPALVDRRARAPARSPRTARRRRRASRRRAARLAARRRGTRAPRPERPPPITSTSTRRCSVS